MVALQFPFTLFRTQKWMDDYGARDMRCGDLTEVQLKTDYHLPDISKLRFNQLRFFRIWFVLQRYNRFGFKPFMTNMEATIEVTGDRQ